MVMPLYHIFSEKKNEFNVNNFEDLVSIMKDQQKLFALVPNTYSRPYIV